MSIMSSAIHDDLQEQKGCISSLFHSTTKAGNDDVSDIDCQVDNTLRLIVSSERSLKTALTIPLWMTVVMKSNIRRYKMFSFNSHGETCLQMTTDQELVNKYGDPNKNLFGLKHCLFVTQYYKHVLLLMNVFDYSSHFK